MDMIALGVMIAGIGIYLVYAFINPEKLSESGENS